jgi:hypothetical protein
MPNEDGYMTADEFKQTYGYDPTPAVQQQAPAERGTLARYGGDIASGAMSAYPAWMALPETIYAGGQALYNSMGTDKSFMDEFGKSMQIEGAQKNITDHLNQVAGQIAQANPGMGEDEIYDKLKEYQHSKQFEDFSMTQLKGGIGAFSKVQDVARGLTGDQRTEEQRDWTDSAAEILGGALVGGPAGIPGKIGQAAAKNIVTRSLLNNPISRTAIKAVELTSPVTIPYTPANVAANAAVGVGLDQAVRYAQGKDTAFTPKTEDDAGVGTLVTSAAAVAGMAAFVAAMHGGQKAALQAATSDLAKTIEKTPSVDVRIAPEPKTGESIITAGAEQQLNPPSAIEDTGVTRSTMTRARGQVFDDQSALLQRLAEHRPDDFRTHEAVFRSNTGPVLEDAVRQSAEVVTHDLFAAIDAATPVNGRAVEGAMIMSTIKARYDRIEQALVDQLASIRDKKSDAYKQAASDLKRIRDDHDESARPVLPELPRSEVNKIANAYETSTDPSIIRVRDAHKAWADTILQLEVRSGRMTQKYANELRRLDPYYTPIMSDPLGGTTGLERVRRSVVSSVKRAQSEGVKGTGGALTNESPIREFELKVPSAKANISAETRITSALNPRTVTRQYSENAYRSLAHQDSRNQAVTWLRTNPDGTPSDFIKNGYMAIEPNPYTGKHWTPAEIAHNNPKINKLLNDPRFVPEWNDGKLRMWKMGDAELALALRHDPVKMNGLMQNVQTTTNWFKYFTTGSGNPVFAVKGALYNIIMQMLFRPNDRAYGTLSYAMHRMLPAPIAKWIGGLIPDPTVLAAMPYHILAATTEFMAHFGAQKMADTLKAQSEFGMFRRMVGDTTFNAMVKKAVDIAAWTENLATLKMMRGNATRGIRSINNPAHVRDAYAMIGDQMPKSVRTAYSFYKGLLDAVYLSGSRPYYTQNHYLLAKKFGGADKIPPNELTRLMYETRTVGGDMSLVPANKTMKDIEAVFPYLSQAKLGAYHLVRNMFGKETYHYVIPRLAMMTTALGAGFYWRTYWNEESRREFWQRRPEYDRYRIIDIPTPTLLQAWANGENPAYNRKLYYSITMPPDLIPIVAGTAAMMQQMGMIPASATPTPIKNDLPLLMLNSLMPAMPPLLQAVLGTAGIKLDPQGADTRGGNIFRTSGSMFKAGPNAESATNLGQVSNSTTAIMQGLFGAMGSYIAGSTDILLHASKYATSVDGVQTLRQQQDFTAGLRAATGAMVEKATASTPDVPLVWQNKERYRVTTPAWQYVATNNNYIRDIVGMRNDATGKAAMRKRQLAMQVGGVPEQAMTDEILVQVANVVTQYQNPTGMLGKLKQQYRDLSAQNRAVSVQYNMPQDQRQARGNQIVRKMQDNMEQQHLAVKYLEQQLNANFGRQLAPRLQGRAFTLETTDKMMRESFGSQPPAQPGEQPQSE